MAFGDTNVVVLQGRVATDIDVKTLPSGKTKGSFRIAHFKGMDQQKNPQTDFFQVYVWERQAELASEMLRKGSRVLITGRLTNDTWNDKETGKPQTRAAIVGDFRVLDKREAADADEAEAE